LFELLLNASMMAVQLIEHIQAAGLKEEGILRIPGSVTRVKVCGCVLSNNLHYNVVFFLERPAV